MVVFNQIAAQPLEMTLYTDSFIIRGTIQTRYKRVTDVLSDPEHHFLVLTDAMVDEYGSRELATGPSLPRSTWPPSCSPSRTSTSSPTPELRTIKVPETGPDLDPAVPDQRPDPPPARAHPGPGAG